MDSSVNQTDKRILESSSSSQKIATRGALGFWRAAGVRVDRSKQRARCSCLSAARAQRRDAPRSRRLMQAVLMPAAELPVL